MNWLKILIRTFGYVIQIAAFTISKSGADWAIWLLWVGFVVILTGDLVQRR